MNMRGRLKFHVACLASSFLALAAGAVAGGDQKASRQEGEYRIYASGQEIGNEKYEITTTADSVTSHSTLEFRNPGDGPKKVLIETRLEADAAYVPRNYELKSDVDGQKGSIRGSFAPNQAIFEYSGNGVSVKNGLLVGDRYSVLDTNTFHHFNFLARLFKYGAGDQPQSFEVVIPQEKDTGMLKIRELGKENIQIRGKKVNTTHLLVDSGALQIQLWVDGRHVPVKIAVPDKKIEVIQSQ